MKTTKLFVEREADVPPSTKELHEESCSKPNLTLTILI